MAIELVEYINLVLKVLRWTIVGLNSLVIVAAFYFMVSGNDLAGDKLDTRMGVVTLLGLSCVITAIVGIVGAVWWGSNCKVHLGIILSHTILAMTIMIIGAFLGLVFVKDPNGADITFIVFSVIVGVLILKTSLGFAFAIKKTRMLRRLNVVSA